MRLLLIAPSHEGRGAFDSELSAYTSEVGGVELTPSTAIVTVAALAPADFDITLCNETTQEIDFDADSDVVGITANVGQARRATEIAAGFRERGMTVVMGGPHVSLAPEMFVDHCDSMVIGELESIAEAFFDDLRKGVLKPRYYGQMIDLRHSPKPRWDLYPHERVISGIVQMSRGCPFNCTFCDVVQYLGNHQRYKENAQVVKELQNLYDLGFSSVFIADDNFTGHRKVAKSLLAAIAEWNGTEGRDFVALQTQMSINMSKHDDLLEACHRAGLATGYVGVESSDPAALEECDKASNKNLDLIAHCEKIVRAGLIVDTGLIVGFDNDDHSTFARQFEFVMRLTVCTPRISPLLAPATTPLFREMKSQGRLVIDPQFHVSAPPAYISNFLPTQMSRAELYIGLRWLTSKIYDPDNYLQRIDRLSRLLGPAIWTVHGRARRAHRPFGVRYALTALREAVRADARIADVVDAVQAMTRRRPEVGNEINDANLRYLGTFAKLKEKGLYDASWARMDAPPFDTDYSDVRLDHIRRIDAALERRLA